MKLRGNKYLKKLDRYVGIPILFSLGLFRHKRTQPIVAKNLAIMMAPAIGDIVLTSGLINDLKTYDEKLKIILFVPAEYSEAAELILGYDDIVKIDLSNPLATIKLIRTKSVDIFIDASQWARLPALITFFSKSKFTIGFATDGQRKHYIFDRAVDHSNNIHEFYNYKNLSPFYQTSNKIIPALKIKSDNNIDSQKTFVHLKPSGFKSYLKEWPEEYWVLIIIHLLNKGMTVYFTGSNADKESIDNLIIKLKNPEKLINLAGKLSIKQTASELSACKIFISVNTGIMHIASLMKCNLVAIHGPTNPKRWGPLNKNSRIIKSNYPEAPCLNLGFEYNCNDKDGKCMRSISPEIVIQNIDELLSKGNE